MRAARSCGTQIWTSVSRSARPTDPPLVPSRATTVMSRPCAASTAFNTAADWPLFSALGERSLGTTLFGDRMVRRGELEFARLRAGHPLVRRAQAALALEGRQADEQTLFFARRCLYQRHQGLLLVTEVFLPAVLELALAVATDTLINKA